MDVVGLDVEHSVFEALIGEPGKSGERITCSSPCRDGSSMAMT